MAKVNKKTTEETAEYHVKKAFELMGVYKTKNKSFQEHIKDTPRRIIGAWEEYLENINMKPEIPTSFKADGVDSLVVVRDISYSSLCIHHFFPFSGVAHIGYLPTDKIIGLSKLPRIVKFYAKQPQIQERITYQITKHIFNTIDPQFVIVVLVGQHTCCSCRGIESDNPMITSSIMSIDDNPDFSDSLKNEFFNTLKIK